MNQKHLYFLVFTVNKFRLNQLMELIFSPLEKLQKNRITSPFSLLIFISLSGSPASACKRNAWRILSFWITRFGEKLKTMHFQYCLSFLCHTANSLWLSILHMVMYVSMLLLGKLFIIKCLHVSIEILGKL